MRVLTAAACVAALGLVATAPTAGAKKGPKHHHGAKGVTISTYATGFNNPRGLKFGPDGALYVAEGGLGGTNATTPAQCAQVPPPIGPYTGSAGDATLGGRISRVGSDGTVTPVVVGLPSTQTSAMTGALVTGVADVAWHRGQLYGLLTAGGCSHGVPTVPNGVFRVGTGGTWSMVANLSAYLAANPVAHPEAGDFEPDGSWYSMISARGALWAVEANHGEVVRIKPKYDASVRRLVDVSASLGHAVPTAIAHHGVFYLGTLGVFGPNDAVGDEHILKIRPNGRLRIRAGGVEKVLGLAFRRGKLYALEMSRNAVEPAPGTGRIVRIRAGGVAEVVHAGMTFPTGMTVGPDGAFYVSEQGFGFPAGAGRVLRIAIG
jgi:hypothetical protein